MKTFILRISIIVIVILVILYFAYQTLNFRFHPFLFDWWWWISKSVKSKIECQISEGKKATLLFCSGLNLFWGEEWEGEKGRETISENLCNGYGRTAGKQVWSCFKYCFIPLITSLKPSFSSILASATRKRKGENRPVKGDGKDFSLSLGGNQMELTHSQGEPGAVRFIKTQFAADFSSTRPEPPFVKQILS